MEFAEADLSNPLQILKCLEGINVVVQLVGTSNPSQQNNHIIRDIEENVIPHICCIEAAIKTGVKRYIFASSGGAVYGLKSPNPTREEEATNPLCSYGLNKLAVEKYLNMFSAVSKIESVVLRISNVYGPGQCVS